MKPTKEQEDIRDAVCGGDEHIGVEACAGSGKTSTAVLVANALPPGKRAAFVAYTKTIQLELQRRLTRKTAAMTLHSYGWRVCRDAFDNFRTDDRKYHRILRDEQPGWFFVGRDGQPMPREPGKACLALIELIRKTRVDPGDKRALENLVDHYALDAIASDATIQAAAVEAIERGSEDTEVLDFTDMIYLPLKLKLRLERYPVMLVDEVQDFSRMMQDLALAAADRLIVLGDRSQSCFGFDGADPEAMPAMLQRLQDSQRGAKICPLHTTFRCPTKHVEIAQRLVPEITAAPGAQRGSVAVFNPHKLPELAAAGDLVLCRTNAELIGATCRLIKAGVPAIMLGRDFRTSLLDLAYKFSKRPAKKMIDDLHEHMVKEEAAMKRGGAGPTRVMAMKDRCLGLILLAEMHKTADEVIAAINQMTEVKEDPTKTYRDQVRLSSVHRAKGLEAERVFVLGTEKLPLRYKNQPSWCQQQERNIAYICATRSRSELHFADRIPAIFGGDEVAEAQESEDD